MQEGGVKAAAGAEAVDIIYRNCEIFNPFTCEWESGHIAIFDGRIAGIGDYQARRECDLSGARVVPGLIDAHLHIESSLLAPTEFARLVLPHGTTTVVADPHEIANVCGARGISYMLEESRRTALDIFLMLPSCVPATPLDVGGACLSASDLAEFSGRDRICGLGEMMNVPGVLAGDPDVAAKLALFDLIDGHAPLLSGKDLNAYIYAGAQSDHECTRRAEAREKLLRGMYIMMREGSTERNLAELVPLVTACSAPRCCFATDDRHADMLADEGHIDDCIRKSVEYGLDLELALRMATLSAAERFRLHDRGAIAPGRIADFCILEDSEEFRVSGTVKAGTPYVDPGHAPAPGISCPFNCRVPDRGAIRIDGAGEARVIGLVEGQIITRDLRYQVDAAGIPDTERDLLKAVVCDRYRGSGSGTGLVHGFGLQEGGIASSISHDCHNIVAVGVDDGDIIRAIREVVRLGGGMAAVTGDDVTALPLDCAGLMSSLPYEEVVFGLRQLDLHAERLGAVGNPFMHLSFLALTVIPHLRITGRGLFDVLASADVPLFLE
ncbi:adenine deaminase [hydrocarbon metagenome]|uniref:adenine deaminase n=1 Tax=hydrocarbon metagenome TaxID=938273 RepID=A0A0W8FG67_9ZZZZ|nr:adenine deaminase [Methanomicrobiaceae archaeon]